MGEGRATPKTGDTRFADDGTLEVFDGEQWGPYLPPEDGADPRPIFKDFDQPPSPPSGSAGGEQ